MAGGEHKGQTPPGCLVQPTLGQSFGENKAKRCVSPSDAPGEEGAQARPVLWGHPGRAWGN